jgi:hypothetical protein
MTEHLESYLRGGDESDRLLEILGTSSNMRRGGDMDETGTTDECAVVDSATVDSATADRTKDDRTTTDSTTGTSAEPESGEHTPPEGTR